MEKTIYCEVCGEEDCKEIGEMNDRSEEIPKCFVEPKITFKVVSIEGGYIGIITRKNWRVKHEIMYNCVRPQYIHLYGINIPTKDDNYSAQVYFYDTQYVDYMLITPKSINLIPHDPSLPTFRYHIVNIVDEVVVDNINEFIAYLIKIYVR